jgi:hypothetical protein
MEDELVWSRNPYRGLYSPMLGYKVLREEEDVQDLVWLFKDVWKFKCILKSRAFMWLVLMNKIPTWDFMLRRS